MGSAQSPTRGDGAAYLGRGPSPFFRSLPKGLFNVLPVPENAAAELLRDAAADAVFVIGRARTGFLVRQALAGCRTSFSSFHASRHVAVVLEGADLHSAACGVSEAFARSCGKVRADNFMVSGFGQGHVEADFSKVEVWHLECVSDWCV